ncbi:MAG TPA: adenine-specific methyltransferase EcoRI family protein [Pyrinomonadaceae bacterium]|nr:adenine-specific methyltransferase EcoRI family protein [Pyrinomonadaceae bacterium]
MKSLNRGLHAAKSAKKDVFYTQYVDIQKEVEAYLEFDANTFRDKAVYCNCEDPLEMPTTFRNGAKAKQRTSVTARCFV